MSSDHIVVKIEGSLRQVPLFVFAHSLVFQDMFSLPQDSDHPLDGSSEIHPLELTGITLTDFNLYVRVATAIWNTNEPAPPADSLSGFEWAIVWHLADRWDIPSLQTFILRKVEEMYWHHAYAVQLFIFALRTETKDWYQHTLRQLVTRSQSLSADELTLLGSHISAAIISLRDRFRDQLHNDLWSALCQAEHNGRGLEGKGTELMKLYKQGFPSPRRIPFRKEVKVDFDALVAGCKDGSVRLPES